MQNVGFLMRRLKYAAHAVSLPEECFSRGLVHIFFDFQLTSLVTGLICHVYSYIDDPSVLNQLATLGIVAQFEGLLSCHGDEMPMLEDMIVAVDDLATVTFTFFAETPQNKEISLKTLE